jgi:lantibiotic transport system permease protein
MNVITYYITSIKNKILKLKNTFAFWLTIISAIFIPVIYFIYYFSKHESLIPDEGVNPWNKFLVDQIMAAASLLIPLFIVLITSLIIQIEHNSSGIKHLFSLPIPKWSVYFGKLTTVFGMVLFTYLMFFGIMLFAGVVVGLIHKDLNFLMYTPNFERPIKLLFRSFIASLGILGIQFWLSFRIKNFIIPLGIGMVLVIAGLIVFQAEEVSIYFPYAYNRLSLFSLAKDSGNMVWFPTVSYYSFGYFILFSLAGFIDIKRMNVK